MRSQLEGACEAAKPDVEQCGVPVPVHLASCTASDELRVICCGPLSRDLAGKEIAESLRSLPTGQESRGSAPNRTTEAM
jgi:hypothetical protein